YILFNYVLNFDIHYLHMLAILFVLTALCMLIVSRFYPGFSYNEIKFNAVSLTPWRGRLIAYLLLLAGMVALFILFSKNGIA
ncbi:MAG: solute:sodium symporter family transporter, partial [Bacteroidota bacterium]